MPRRSRLKEALYVGALSSAVALAPACTHPRHQEGSVAGAGEQSPRQPERTTEPGEGSDTVSPYSRPEGASEHVHERKARKVREADRRDPYIPPFGGGQDPDAVGGSGAGGGTGGGGAGGGAGGAGGDAGGGASGTGGGAGGTGGGGSGGGAGGTGGGSGGS